MAASIVFGNRSGRVGDGVLVEQARGEGDGRDFAAAPEPCAAERDLGYQGSSLTVDLSVLDRSSYLVSDGLDQDAV
jgi:hypothetical protein